MGPLAQEIESLEGKKHSRMPYYSVSDKLLKEKDMLFTLVSKSIQASK